MNILVKAIDRQLTLGRQCLGTPNRDLRRGLLEGRQGKAGTVALAEEASAGRHVGDPRRRRHETDLAGEILSPGRTDEIATTIVDFILRPVP